MSNEDLVYRLRKRAEIRRNISTRKSVQEGKPDRIANLMEEAADRIEELERNMNKPCDTEIKLVTCPEGDWEKVYADGKFLDAGHSIDWQEIIKFLGYNLVVTEISNEEMENSSYE